MPKSLKTEFACALEIKSHQRRARYLKLRRNGRPIHRGGAPGAPPTLTRVNTIIKFTKIFKTRQQFSVGFGAYSLTVLLFFCCQWRGTYIFVENVLSFFKKATVYTNIKNKKATQLYSMVYGSKQHKHNAASNNDTTIS